VSLNPGEITNKGSVNQRAVLNRRAALIDDLYAAEPAVHLLALNRLFE